METIMIDVDKIKFDPNQPRKTFQEVEQLAKNIALEGQIHPIEVDENYVIIVGERRYRAIKSLGLKQIKATVNTQKMTPYERLRRQMGENLHQSAAKNGDSMPPIETAKGWVKLYELKTGKAYSPGELGVKRSKQSGKFLPTILEEIVEEVGAKKTTVWELLDILEQPKYVLEAIEKKDIPRTYFREVERAPKEVREKLRKKIVAGDYKSREEIAQDVALAKINPDLAYIQMERNRQKENTMTNSVLNKIVELGLALSRIPLSKMEERDRKITYSQLKWLLSKINSYLEE